MSAPLPLRPAQTDPNSVIDGSEMTEDGFVMVKTEIGGLEDPTASFLDSFFATVAREAQEQPHTNAHPLDGSRTPWNPFPTFLQSGLSSPPNVPEYPSIPTVPSGFVPASIPRTDNGYEGPPFEPCKTLFPIFVGHESISPVLVAKINNGFFMSSDNNWTCYRRNYFSVTVSFGLDGWESGKQMDLLVDDERRPIQAFAVSLSAYEDTHERPAVEIYQHTPKRENGPRLAVPKVITQPRSPGITLEVGDPSSPQYTGDMYTFEHLQFKNGTRHNGRISQGNSHCFRLVAELWADVQDPGAETLDWIKIATLDSTPVVVRGRAPLYYGGPPPLLSTNVDAVSPEEASAMLFGVYEETDLNGSPSASM